MHDRATATQRPSSDPIPPPTTQLLLTVDEVAEILRISSKTVRKLVRNGRLASIRPGRSVRVLRSSVDGLF